MSLNTHGARISRLSQSVHLGSKSLVTATVGIAPTSSQTNTQPKTIHAHARLKTGAKQIFSDIYKSMQSGGSWRLASHALLVAVVVCVAFAGKIQADSLTLSNTGGQATIAAQDQSSQLQSGAILAQQARLLISPDIQARATTSAAQTQLVTTDESYLTKRAPMAVGDATQRGVQNYTILAGDSVATIASKFNVASDTIQWANNLDENSTLKPGQQLIILPVNGVLYAAQGGESVASLASTYQASANLIDSYNQLEGKAPVAGQKLIIPDGTKPSPKPVAAPVANTRLANVAPFRMNISGFGNSYSYGYCTYYVASRRAIPSNWGNASSWYYNAIATGYSVGSTPAAGAVAWENGNHVAYVERVNDNGTVTVSEMNYWGNGGGWNRVSYRTTASSHFKYIY